MFLARSARARLSAVSLASGSFRIPVGPDSVEGLAVLLGHVPAALVDPFRNTRTGSQQKRPGGDNHRQDQCLIAVELHSSASLYVRKANMGVPPCQECRRITVLSYKDSTTKNEKRYVSTP